MDKLGGGGAGVSPPAYLSPGMLFPHLHYPALLAHHAQMLQQREKSAFSPIMSKSANSSTNNSPNTPPSPPLDSPPGYTTANTPPEDDKSLIPKFGLPSLSGKR